MSKTVVISVVDLRERNEVHNPFELACYYKWMFKEHKELKAIYVSDYFLTEEAYIGYRASREAKSDSK